MRDFHFRVTASVALAIDVARFTLSEVSADVKARFVQYTFTNDDEHAERFRARNIVVDGIVPNGMRYNINVFLEKDDRGIWMPRQAIVTPIPKGQSWGEAKIFWFTELLYPGSYGTVPSNRTFLKLPDELLG